MNMVLFGHVLYFTMFLQEVNKLSRMKYFNTNARKSDETVRKRFTNNFVYVKNF